MSALTDAETALLIEESLALAAAIRAARVTSSRRFGFEGCIDGQWAAAHCGVQDSSNYLTSREEAEAELPRLAESLDCSVHELRVVEIGGAA